MPGLCHRSGPGGCDRLDDATQTRRRCSKELKLPLIHSQRRPCLYSAEENLSEQPPLLCPRRSLMARRKLSTLTFISTIRPVHKEFRGLRRMTNSFIELSSRPNFDALRNRLE